MAVRTDQAGVKNKRRVGARSAQPSMGTASSKKKTWPRDDAAALRRTKSMAKMRLGPAAQETEYERGRIPSTVNGRKKAPSDMKVKHRGGPFKRTRLHGG